MYGAGRRLQHVSNERHTKAVIHTAVPEPRLMLMDVRTRVVHLVCRIGCAGRRHCCSHHPSQLGGNPDSQGIMLPAGNTGGLLARPLDVLNGRVGIGLGIVWLGSRGLLDLASLTHGHPPGTRSRC